MRSRKPVRGEQIRFNQQKKGLAVITGASSGLGAEFARQLAQQGYNLLLVARRSDRLLELARSLSEKYAVDAETMAVDLSRESELELLVERLANAEVEVLINNAGFAIEGRFFETDFDSQERMVRVHIAATLRLAHAVLPKMVSRNSGAIVNVSSLGAFMAMPNNAVYGATKAFLNSFTKSLDLDLAGRCSGVRAQVLCPGFMRTEFHADMQDSIAKVPGWAWMSTADVVRASLRGLDRGKTMVIPGWYNKLLVALLSWMPSGWKRWLGRRQAQSM